MNTPFSAQQKQNWNEVRNAAGSLAQAGALITEACRKLERFFHPDDPDNWDRTFAWKLNELEQAAGLCREVEQHLKSCAKQAEAGDRPAER